MPLASGTRIGAYVVSGPLGASGMGEVYRARDSRLNRDVALKVLPQTLLQDSDYKARFEREAQVLGSLNHPHPRPLPAKFPRRSQTPHPLGEPMSRIRPKEFAHVVYRTRRFAQMLHWYETVFDAKVQHQNPALAFLTYDDEHHRFAFVNMAVFQPNGTDTDRQGAVGVDHVAYTYASVSDLLENYAFLKEHGITPFWCIHHGMTIALYYADPDGNQMEFQVDSFTTKEEANDYMNGPLFAANPLGVEFNPDEWLTRIRSGAPESDFLVRTVHEPVSPLRGAIAEVIAAG
jgi:serine/threonine protein kinase